MERQEEFGPAWGVSLRLVHAALLMVIVWMGGCTSSLENDDCSLRFELRYIPRTDFALGARGHLQERCSGILNTELEISGDGLIIEERDDFGVDVFAESVGRGFIVVRSNGDEVFRKPYTVAPIAKVELGHDDDHPGLTPFSEPYRFLRTSRGLDLPLRYIGPEGQNLVGRELLELDRPGELASTQRGDRYSPERDAVGRFEPRFRSADRVLPLSYEVVERAHSISFETARSFSLIYLRALVFDDEGERLIAEPEWRVDGEAIERVEINGQRIRPLDTLLFGTAPPGRVHVEARVGEVERSRTIEGQH
ncbi:MAG: hypothetical protein AAF938_09210 [Myxococcota bacterium]